MLNIANYSFVLRTDMALQLLEHSKKAGEKIYRYYSIAEPYRERGKNKKRVLAHLGALELNQVSKIRNALRLHNDSDVELIRPDDVSVSGTWSFLDISVFHEIWKSVGLDRIIQSGGGDVELAKLLEILVLNRIVSPASKLGITRWYPSTALDKILGISVSAIEETRIYRSLCGIDEHQEKIEQHLFQKFITKDKSKPNSLYFYDLSSSYFEGERVELGAFNGRSKDHRPDCLQVVLGLLINERGVPFSWDIFRGNQSDAPTLVQQLKKFKKRFGIENALLVFDRGFLSHDNLEAVERAGYQYLTGLRAPAIETLLSVYSQPWLNEINKDNVGDVVAKQKNWERFDETSYYCSLGVVNERKTILLFDTSRYRLAIISRQKRIDEFKAWVEGHNRVLADFKKDAEKTAIQKDIQTEVRKRSLEEFVSFELHEYTTENETFQRRKNNPYPSQGYIRKIHSFQIIVKESNHHLLDGVFALITSPKSNLQPSGMMEAYRQKYLIESAFREMKSILKLRPWFVYKAAHIRAHYTVCVLAYCLERLLDLLLEEHKCKEDGWTLPRVKEELERHRVVELVIGNAIPRRTLSKAPADVQALLKKLKLGSALRLP